LDKEIKEIKHLSNKTIDMIALHRNEMTGELEEQGIQLAAS
jgi:hypothetical protein